MAEVRPLRAQDLPEARALLEKACTYDDLGITAEEKLFGPAANGPWRATLGVRENGELAGLVVVSGHWLRLLAVDPAYRRRGIGSRLLQHAESVCRKHREIRLRTLDQPGNYVSPGINVENTEAIQWLEKRGFRHVGKNHNLLIDVEQNPRVTETALADACSALAPDYEIRRASPDDLTTLGAAVRDEFSAGWAFEIENAIRRPAGATHVAIHSSGDWAAFAAHGGNNSGLGWFGPAGTWPAHRGKGLGRALLLACLLDVSAAGLSQCTIAWIGPRGFYDQVAGVAADKFFAVLEKELT